MYAKFVGYAYLYKQYVDQETQNFDQETHPNDKSNRKKKSGIEDYYVLN